MAATTMTSAPPTAIGGPHSKEAQTSAHANELGDQSEKISENQITHGEKAPKFSEAIEDEFGVAAMGDGTEAHRHFLNDESHNKSENDKGNEKADAVARTVGGIGEHAWRIVFAEEDQNSRANQKPQQPEASKLFGPARPAGARHFPAVTSAIHVFVSNQTDQFRSSGGGHGRLGGRMGRLAA